jgi:c(7)-type cytochrome triheme protein
MRNLIALLATVALVGVVTVVAQDKKPPEKIVLSSKQGATTFLHAKHIEREDGECTACHDKLWPQSTELRKVSAGCRTCHKVGGKAFEEKDHCERCHPKDAEKSQ